MKCCLGPLLSLVVNSLGEQLGQASQMEQPLQHLFRRMEQTIHTSILQLGILLHLECLSQVLLRQQAMTTGELAQPQQLEADKQQQQHEFAYS